MALLRPMYRSLYPNRILLAARDRRFLRLTRFLLARNGFLVETTSDPGELLELVEEHDPHVAVVDGSDSLDEAARNVAAMEALHPHVGVLVVAEEPEHGETDTVRVLPKWSTLEWLAHAVERAFAEAEARATAAPVAGAAVRLTDR